MAVTLKEDSFVRRCVEAIPSCLGVVVQGGLVDRQRPGVVVADEEDCSATLVSLVVTHDRALDLQRVVIAVVVDRAATSTARRSGPGRIRTVTDRSVVF